MMKKKLRNSFFCLKTDIDIVDYEMFTSDQNRVVVVSGGAERAGFTLGVQHSKANKRKRCHIVLDFSGSEDQFLEDVGMTHCWGTNPSSEPSSEYHFLATPFKGDQMRMFLRLKTLTDLGATYELKEANLEQGSNGFIGRQEMQDWGPFKDFLFTEAGQHEFQDAISTVLSSSNGHAIRGWQLIIGDLSSDAATDEKLATVVTCSSEARTLHGLSQFHRLPIEAQEFIFTELYRQLMAKMPEISKMSGHLQGN